MSSTELLLEVILMVLLVATMFHAFRLERALGVLRRDRAALEELVLGFNESTKQAEAGVERLRETADGAGRQIARQVEAAQALKSDLEFLTARGEKVADELDGLIRTAKPVGVIGAELPAQASSKLAARNVSTPAELPVSEMRPRSQAERDLLRALRSAT